MIRLIPGILLLACIGSAQRPAFEVVSIKPNNSGSPNGGMGPRGSRLVATNVTLKGLLFYAYSPLLDEQILNAPDWAKTDRYDVEAKPPGDGRLPPAADLRAMMQSLLDDSFQLKAHRETRDLPIYNLVLTKTGPKRSADQTLPDPHQQIISFVTEGSPQSPLPRGGLRMTAGQTTTTMEGTAVSIDRIVSVLRSKSDRIIIDKTAFTDLIDVHFNFRQDLGPDPSADQSGPSLFTAIQEIGLKLEPSKAPLEVLVIDHAQHPPAN